LDLIGSFEVSSKVECNPMPTVQIIHFQEMKSIVFVLAMVTLSVVAKISGGGGGEAKITHYCKT
jgi:hypothetical protein